VGRWSVDPPGRRVLRTADRVTFNHGIPPVRGDYRRASGTTTPFVTSAEVEISAYEPVISP